MAVSLEESKNNTTDDIDVAVIDEFRKESAIIDALVFDDVVNPAGGGDTLTYGYRRQKTQGTADFREINNEYEDGNVETERFTVDLAVLGGSFKVDRVTAKLGPAASGNVALNVRNKVKATNARFTDAVINGDTDVDANGFDGLSKALRGSSTESGLAAVKDWSDLDTVSSTPFKVLDAIDDLLSLLDGPATLLIGNDRVLSKVRAVGRRANMYVESPVEGLVDSNGNTVVRQKIGNTILIDAGAKAGSNDRIIPIRARDLDDSVYTLQVTGAPAGGTFTLTVTIEGEVATTEPIAHNASNADIKAALEALEIVPKKAASVTGSGTLTIKFVGGLKQAAVGLALGANDLSGGETPSVAITEVAVTADEPGVTDLYAVRIGLDGFHGASTVGGQLISTWLPEFNTSGAVKRGEVELGPIGVALKATKAAAVLRNIRV